MTCKEKKELLNSFLKIEGRIKDLEDELEALWSNATSSPINTSGMPKGGVGVNKIENAIERMERLVNLIDRERDELEAVKFRIMAAVRELPDITERRIIHLKYIGKADGKFHRSLPLWKIANELGYSLDRIKHIHSNAILHLGIKDSTS